jgi:catechol-2,3-dioxygenase
MNLGVHSVTINALDAWALATFWAHLLGGQPEDSGNGYVLVETETGGLPRLLFAPVTEHAHAPGRIHLDLTSDDRAGEVTRAMSLGATLVGERSDSNFSWTVLADPEGNLFCIG